MSGLRLLVVLVSVAGWLLVAILISWAVFVVSRDDRDRKEDR